jgi:hypothetical protein
LTTYRALLALPDADTKHFNELQAWFEDDKGGHFFLHGAESMVWDPAFRKDLTSLAVREGDEKDLFTRFIRVRALPLYHAILGQGYKRPLKITDPFTGDKQETPVYEYSDNMILAIVNSTSTTLASLVPALSSLALYFITDPLARVGAIVGFTFLFSVTLTIITKAKRVECFAVTAAFSAVLVVFVGNSGPSCCDRSA